MRKIRGVPRIATSLLLLVTPTDTCLQHSPAPHQIRSHHAGTFPLSVWCRRTPDKRQCPNII